MRNPTVAPLVGIQAAIYLRQSLDRDKNLLAISRQRGPCLDLCTARGWLNPVEYVDNDTSATRGKREAYERMLRDIEAGKIQAIAVWDLDRLYRRPVELEYLIDLADRHGLLLASVTGDVDLSTDNGRLFARIKGAVAKAETERKGARQVEANAQRARMGKRGPGRRTFGYTESGEPHPVEAAIVRAAYEDLLAGVTLWSIAKQWNEAGLKTSLGNEWVSSVVGRLLKSPQYAGKREYRGEIVADSEAPALVDASTWTAVHAHLSRAGRRAVGSGGRGKYMLTRIPGCGRCDDGTRFGTAVGSNGVSYRCRACFLSRNQLALDDHITDLVVGRLSKPDAVELVLARDRPDLDEIRAQAAGYEKRLDALAVEFADGDLTASQLRTATERIKAKIAEADSLIIDATRHQVFAGVVGADDVGAAFLSLDRDRQRAIISNLMDITIYPGPKGRGFRTEGIEIDWHE
ncbi:recombinase family protein [Nocardia sp. NPDC059239]|uniref:recombinase family protein n=1 Tax=unclassified Nocardia TaxID=2637762 RepID=UPI00369FBC61